MDQKSFFLPNGALCTKCSHVVQSKDWKSKYDFAWHLFYDYAKHPKILVMMKMMTLHHHAHQQESMLHIDFVVALNFIF